MKEKAKAIEDWKVLLIMEKFDQRKDGADRTAYSLKETVSKEAWKKIKDLFYYDSDCEAWLTTCPEKVIDRLKDSEWKLEAEVFDKIANSVSLNNAETFYKCFKIIKKAPLEIFNLIHKAVKKLAGNRIEFSDKTRVLSRTFNNYDKTEKIIVEKENQEYVIFLLWMTSIDDAGFCGMIWKKEDVENTDDKMLKKAIETDMALSILTIPEVEIN